MAGLLTFYCDVFSRHRFLQIHWILHLELPVPYTGPITRGSKVKNFVHYIQNKSLQNFTPAQKIAVDESTVGFKGRIAFKAYNPQKPTKWGLRIYVLSCFETGYISSFEPYLGKETTESLSFPQLQFTTRIILHLYDKVLTKAGGSGYHKYSDHYYTASLWYSSCLKEKLILQAPFKKTGLDYQNRLKNSSFGIGAKGISTFC